jgi:hypothetical protein
MDSQKKDQFDGETIYVLSKEDAERIEEMIERIKSTFWELLSSRKVDFPNPMYRRAYKNLRKELLDF